MRDVKDPGTIEMKLPKKAGRKPVGDAAMTAAERAREYRQRRKEQKAKGRLAPVDERVAATTSTMALLDTLRECVTRHDKENARRLLGLLWLRVDALEEIPEDPDAYGP